MRLVPLSTVRAALALGFACASLAADVPEGSQTTSAPPAPRNDALEVIHGASVADPFRPLELWDAPATIAWREAQAALLARKLSRSTTRSGIRERLEKLLDFHGVTAPVERGGLYFYSRVRGLRTQDLGVLHVGDEPFRPRVLLDVKKTHGESMMLQGFVPSPDGRKVAYLLRAAGSTSLQLRFVETATGSESGTAIDGIHILSASPVWRQDSSGIFYLLYNPQAPASQPESQERLFLRAVTPGRGQDLEIRLSDEGPGWLHTPRVSEDGRFLVVTAQQASAQKNRVGVLDIGSPIRTGASLSSVVSRAEDALTFLGNQTDQLFFYTDRDAPNGRIVAMPPRLVSPAEWRTIVPEQPEAIAAHDQTGGNALGFYGGRFVLMYFKDGQPFLRLFDVNGRVDRVVALPPAGSIWGGFSGRSASPEVFYQFLGMTEPTTIYRLDVRNGSPSVSYRAPLPFEAGKYVVRQQFYRSADGTAVPIFVAHRRGIELDGSHPAVVYGYGALGWVSFIWYQPHLLTWLEMGGVYAQPGVRGGGEYGAAWHDGATKANKEKTVADYIAAAEWLVAQGYTSPSRLVANGGSLSGPLGAIAAIRRPDLFAAAVIDRPITDLLRYEKHGHAAVWVPELGSVENADEFRALYRLSPYHAALSDGTCPPPVLVLSGELDRTAPPFHGAKLVAALQSRGACAGPYLFHLMPKAGHNFGQTSEVVVDSFTTWLTFLADRFGLAPPLAEASSVPSQSTVVAKEANP